MLNNIIYNKSQVANVESELNGIFLRCYWFNSDKVWIANLKLLKKVYQRHWQAGTL